MHEGISQAEVLTILLQGIMVPKQNHCFCRRMFQIALQTGFRCKLAPRPLPLQLPRLYPLAGNQQWSSRFPLKLGKQLLHGSGKAVQYQGHKCAYGLEGSDSLLKQLGQVLACFARYIALDNALDLPLQLADKPEGALHGLLPLNPLR
jgi:hypothetical protein